MCNAAAQALGVTPGMPVNAALALAPYLQLQHREPRLERQVLERLASAGLRFTPSVCIEPCEALLLEIAASARLFGDLGQLIRLITDDFRFRGHAFVASCAPAARAALWLARAGHSAVLLHAEGLNGVLCRLPITSLKWPSGVCDTLQKIGVRLLSDCIRLPRDGLARRIGVDRLQELDEAFGRRAELREFHRPQPCFRDALDLPADVVESAGLLQGVDVLLERLGEQLRIRQSAVSQLSLRLAHRCAPPAVVRVGMLQASADVRHLRELIGLHLSTLRVSQPVAALAVEAALDPVRWHDLQDLFGERIDPGQQFIELVERLRMRLGFPAVHGVSVAADNRPERAWKVVADVPGKLAVSPADPLNNTPASRPLWLFPVPCRLRVRGGRPLFEGKLEVESGPERIETGWWDGPDIRRDYYVTANPYGMRLWVFRDYRQGGWYLHGLFG
jgi:protein ImuB